MGRLEQGPDGKLVIESAAEKTGGVTNLLPGYQALLLFERDVPDRCGLPLEVWASNLAADDRGVPSDGTEQGGFARTVGADNGPVLALQNAPSGARKNVPVTDSQGHVIEGD